MKGFFITLLVFTCTVHSAAQESQAVARRYPPFAIDSLEEQSLYTVYANLDGCFQRMRNVIRIKKVKGSYFATLREFGRVTGEGSTSNVDNTYKWRKLSSEQAEAVRMLELRLMSQSGERDDSCPKFVLSVPAQKKRYEVETCDREFYSIFKKTLFY